MTDSAEFSGELLSVETRRVLSVAELTKRIRGLLESGIGEVWVAGEISNYKAPSSGHRYFTLKDEESCLNAVMFRADAGRVGFALKDGMAVLVRGEITVYEARGQYQIIVSEIQPRGQGTLQQRFEALKKKLADEGLFAPERKRELPVFPEVVGIVTSLQGAVLQDFTRILKRRAPGIRVRVRGVRVQGVGAAEEISEAIRAFNLLEDVELIVVARGGGSLEDLWAFNEEVVARALAASKIPTVSAVGHETDFTIADFVADLRAPTPSAAAELISRDWSEWREELQQWLDRMDRAVARGLESRRERWERFRQSYVFREPKRIVQQWQQQVDDHAENLSKFLRQAVIHKRHQMEKIELRFGSLHPEKRLEQARERLKNWQARLISLGPEATLKRGYALMLDEKGKIVRSADQMKKDQKAMVRLAKGEIDVRVENIRKKRE